MAEVSGITELQLLETEVVSLEKTLKAVQGAEKTSSACSRVLQKMKQYEDKDGFVHKEGREMNQYHTSAGQGADGGCCVVS